MSRLRVVIGMAALTALLSISTLLVTVVARMSPCPVPRTAAVARGCAAAAGEVRVLRLWLQDQHPRRAQALLLLQSAASWAPVCAPHEDQGIALRDQIVTSVAGDTAHALPLSQRLLALLE